MYHAKAARSASKSAYRTTLDVLFRGVAVIVPLVITIYLFKAAFNIVTNALSPVIQLLEWAGLIEGVKDLGFVRLLLRFGVYENVVGFLTELIAVVILVCVVFVIGSLASVRHGERLVDTVDYVIASIPGLGSVYRSFRRMGDVLVETDTESFREVKLVEFPHDGTYTLGFLTAEAPPTVRDAAGHGEMQTLFLPMAPNPVMGGFLVNVPTDRVSDVDMTVEEGVQAVVTSGVAAGGESSEDGGVEGARDGPGLERAGDGGTDGEGDGGPNEERTD
jgi:uncharacterized membrane protein